jgi:ATP-dependent Lon protease
MFLPMAVGRQGSSAAVETALNSEEKTLLLVAQRDAANEQPGYADLYTVGTRAVIKKMARSGENVELLVQGIDRVEMLSAEQTEPYLRVQAKVLPAPQGSGEGIEALHRAVVEAARKVFDLARPDTPVDINQIIAQAGDPLRFCYLLGTMLGLDVAKEQAILEANQLEQVQQLLLDVLAHEAQILELRNQITSRAQTEMGKEQRDYLLRQQLRAIQDELGEKSPEKAEVDELRQRIAETDLPDNVRKEAERELNKLERMSPMAPDSQVTRSYLELIMELPWKKHTTDRLELTQARQILDEDHYDLQAIKKRILEHLAVLKLNPEAKAPILCFVGPPGVGKTSLGQSIARAMGRAFERASLGGLHDESELRGHRRTYIGAMPGRIIQSIRRAGANNPVLMLDEVDKLGRDYRGDPAAALLEILDPAQNNTFRDNYLDLPFDLSKVFFIATANALDAIPGPLLDRLEILRLSGYSEEEKVEIARRYLIPRQWSQTGLRPEQLAITDAALKQVVSRYTREAGVRQLEQMLGRIARQVAVRFAEGNTAPVVVDVGDLHEVLSAERFSLEKARKELPPGVATGLAWTEAGGDVLYVEATLFPHARILRLTGQLGKVMRESAKIAQSLIWSQAKHLGIDPARFEKTGIHVHVPAGAVPKDGPSAGVTLVTALASLYTGVPARADTAMTGEVTLTGLVLPIGGVKEKVLAARRAGLSRVILPKANEKDLAELPDNVRKEMTFILAESIDQVLAEALEKKT